MNDSKIIASQYEYKVTWSSEDAVYIGRVAEFPSLAAHGETPESALREIQFVVQCVLEEMEEKKQQPPQPINIREYSGRLNIRLPKYIHRQLASEAAWQSISLNQLILSKLARNLEESKLLQKLEK